MTIALAAVLALLVGLLVSRRLRARRGAGADVERDTTPAIEAWLADSLEGLLAETVLGTTASTPEERRPLARSLRGNPDPDVVSRVEEMVRAVELEYVKYAHETEAELTLRVRYEDGRATTASRRLAWTEVPEAVRADFDRRGGTRVFRTWAFPWSRMSAL